MESATCPSSCSVVLRYLVSSAGAIHGEFPLRRKSRSRKSAWGMVGAGLTLASCLFPPAGAVTTALAIAAGANKIVGANLLGDFSPTYTEGTSHSESNTKGKTDTIGHSQGKAISSNIVNPTCSL